MCWLYRVGFVPNGAWRGCGRHATAVCAPQLVCCGPARAQRSHVPLRNVATRVVLQTTDTQKLVRELFHMVSKRPDSVCNFLEGGRCVAHLAPAHLHSTAAARAQKALAPRTRRSSFGAPASVLLTVRPSSVRPALHRSHVLFPRRGSLAPQHIIVGQRHAPHLPALRHPVLRVCGGPTRERVGHPGPGAR